MLERRGRLETFPYRLRAEKLSMVFLLATGHEPLAISSPRTTYYAPRTRRADTLVRPNDENAHHEPQSMGQSHRPLAAASSYRPREPNGLRELESRPARSPSLARVARNNGDDAKPQPRLLKRSWTPAFAGVTREEVRGGEGE